MPDFVLDEHEKLILEETSKDISKIDMEQVNKEKIKAIYNADNWLEENS